MLPFDLVVTTIGLPGDRPLAAGPAGGAAPVLAPRVVAGTVNIAGVDRPGPGGAHEEAGAPAVSREGLRPAPAPLCDVFRSGSPPMER